MEVASGNVWICEILTQIYWNVRDARVRKETKKREETDGVKIAIIFCHWL
jgi:hypothetical protein